MARLSQLKVKYGLTAEGFAALLERQGNRCAICQASFEEAPTAVDHDQSCCAGRKSCGKCVRGVLCKKCNAGLGLLGDSPENLERAIAYLNAARVAGVRVT